MNNLCHVTTSGQLHQDLTKYMSPERGGINYDQVPDDIGLQSDWCKGVSEGIVKWCTGQSVDAAAAQSGCKCNFLSNFENSKDRFGNLPEDYV